MPKSVEPGVSPFKPGEQLVSLAEAAHLTPYTSEYLRLIARKGSLKAVKVDDAWFTTEQAVLAYYEKQKAKHLKFMEKMQSLEKRGLI